jgi:hypothetical protein
MNAALAVAPHLKSLEFLEFVAPRVIAKVKVGIAMAATAK